MAAFATRLALLLPEAKQQKVDSVLVPFSALAIFVAAVIPFEGDEVQLILPVEQQLSGDALQWALTKLNTAALKLRAKLPKHPAE